MLVFYCIYEKYVYDGDCYFNTYIPKDSNVKIKYNIDLCVNNVYVGGTYVTKDLF